MRRGGLRSSGWSWQRQPPWFQIVTLFNPLTYMSEGIRGALIPNLIEHMNAATAAVALAAAMVVTGAIGIRGFLRRAID